MGSEGNLQESKTLEEAVSELNFEMDMNRVRQEEKEQELEQKCSESPAQKAKAHEY